MPSTLHASFPLCLPFPQRPGPGVLRITWTFVTAAATFALRREARAGKALLVVLRVFPKGRLALAGP